MNHVDQRETLAIDQFELGHWPTPSQLPGGYELMLIQAGSGCSVINGSVCDYRPGDVFLLRETDRYAFRIRQQTCFLRLSFSASYVAGLTISGAWLWRYFDSSTLPATGPLTADLTEQQNVRALLLVLLSEKRSRYPLATNPIADALMKAILSLVDRLIDQRVCIAVHQPSFASDLTRRLITYISQHLGEPDRLRMDILADTFNYSPGHLSALFKQQVGDSIQQFIIRLKLRQVASRLRHTSLTISQIADEFGFSDVCHLNKLFKRYYNHTPTTYRQTVSL